MYMSSNSHYSFRLEMCPCQSFQALQCGLLCLTLATMSSIIPQSSQNLLSTWREKYRTAVGAVARPTWVEQWVMFLRWLPLGCCICPSLEP